MGERIKVFEKNLTLQQRLGDMKEIPWTNIIDSINDVWPSIQAIFKQTELGEGVVASAILVAPLDKSFAPYRASRGAGRSNSNVSVICCRCVFVVMSRNYP